MALSFNFSFCLFENVSEKLNYFILSMELIHMDLFMDLLHMDLYGFNYYILKTNQAKVNLVEI